MSIRPISLGSAGPVSGAKIVAALTNLQSPNKLPASAIQNAVLSVNGRTGNIVLNSLDFSAQPLSTNLTKISSAIMNSNSFMAMDSSGNFTNMPYTTYGSSLLTFSDATSLRNAIGLSEAAVMSVNQPNGLLKLDADGKIPLSKINSSFSTVASTGNYNDLNNKPTLFLGSYNDLTNKPSLFSGEYVDLKNRPIFSLVASTGSFNDLLDKPSIPPEQVNSDWNSAVGPSSILNKPSIFSGIYSDLTGKPQLFSGIYSDLVGRPTLSAVATSGSYLDLINKPSIFSGSYNDLSDKPTIPTVNYPVTSVNSKNGDVVLNSLDVGAAPVVHSHAVADVVGLQATLDGKISIGSSIPYNTLTGAPAIPTNTNQLTNGSGFITQSQSISAAPVQSVNTKTGAVILSASDVGAAQTIHTHVISDVTGLQVTLDSKISTGSTIPYSVLTGTPSIPVNNTFTLKGLNDTDDIAIPNGFLRWNSSGTSVSYATTIPYASINGAPTLSTVAISGSYGDLTNKPIIPSNTSQIAEQTNLYYTDTRVQTYLNSNGYRRAETLQGTTNSSGVYQVTFANTYTVAPHVNPVIINGTPAQVITISNLTATGCTLTVVQRSSVTLLSVEVLLAATTPVSAATVAVLVVPKS